MQKIRLKYFFSYAIQENMARFMLIQEPCHHVCKSLIYKHFLTTGRKVVDLYIGMDKGKNGLKRLKTPLNAIGTWHGLCYARIVYNIQGAVL